MDSEDPPTAILAFLQAEFATGEQKEVGLIDWEWLADNFREDVLPAFLQHIYLCFVSLAIAVAGNFSASCINSATRCALALDSASALP